MSSRLNSGPWHAPTIVIAGQSLIQNRIGTGTSDMLLELTTTMRPAPDLGFLLHKNPARAQSFDLAFGRVHIFYPEASAGRCSTSPLSFVARGRRGLVQPAEKVGRIE